MQNFVLLKALGKCGRPVLLEARNERHDQGTADVRRIYRGAWKPNVILCERGIRTFETATRNTCDISAIPVLNELTHFPVILDPSHATGKRSLVPAVSRAAVAIGADGLIVEVHPAPEKGHQRRRAIAGHPAISKNDEGFGAIHCFVEGVEAEGTRCDCGLRRSEVMTQGNVGSKKKDNAETQSSQSQRRDNKSGRLRKCRWGLNWVQQYAKGLVLSPAIDSEVLVERQYIRGFKFVRQANKAGVGEVDFSVPVFSQSLFYRRGFLGYLERDLENSGKHVVDDRLRGTWEIAQQIATFGNHGLTGD